MQGRSAMQSAKLQQKQLEENAKRTRAASQQVADQYIQESRLMESRATAVAAASGAGGGPQVAKIIGDIGAEGQYRALMALYNGETTARTQEFAGEVSEFEGKSAQRASYLQAGGTLMGASSTAWDKGWVG